MYVCIYLFESQNCRERGRERACIHWFTPQEAIAAEAEVGREQELLPGPPGMPEPRLVARSWIGGGIAGTEISAHVECWHGRRCLYQLHHDTSLFCLLKSWE